MNMRFNIVIPLALSTSLAMAEGDEFFTSKIEPLLKQHCFACHSHEKKIQGGLALDSKSGWEKGGDSGPAVVPGKPEDSLNRGASRKQIPISS
ncbi:MAG: c-type cytochrome domain-containing protein [Limisphaerales bacterium]